MKYRSLRSRRIFKIVYSKGNFLKGRLLGIAYSNLQATISEKTDMLVPSVAFAVSKKISASAVERNLWKRRMREALRQISDAISREIAIVIQARKAGAAPGVSELKVEIETLFKKISD